MAYRGLGRTGRSDGKKDRQMPQYFFNIRNHVNTDDYVGLDLVDLEAARVEAEKDIVDIMQSRSTALGNHWPQWSIEICDHARKVLMVVPFSKN
jgi:hypothetical protein